MEVSQIFPLLVLKNTKEVTRVQLELGSETLRHQGHKFLEVAELSYSLNDFRILYSFQVLLKLSGESLAETRLELFKLLVEALEL